jgi:Fe-S-cluster containining protein
MADLPWYRDGLRFTCTQCGDCCTGAPGHVWVSNDEIAALAQLLGLSEETFEDTYVRRVGARKSLRELPGGNCVLLDGEKRSCTVYSARPRQCRTWPFWDSNLKSPEDWAHTCQVCPGSGRGQLHSLSQIEEQRKIIKV